MYKTEINKEYMIYVGDGIQSLVSPLTPKRVFVVTQEKFAAKYLVPLVGDLQRKGREVAQLILSDKKTKDFAGVNLIAKELNAFSFDPKSDLVIALGGSKVCDLTGFTSAVYKHGINFGVIATTLMAMVDNGIKGLEEINVGRSRNCLGCYHQPQFVVADTSCLLEGVDDDISVGLVEIAKCGMIGSSKLWQQVFSCSDYKQLVPQAIALKKSFIEYNENEPKRRQKLNFGWTIADAIIDENDGIELSTAYATGILAELMLSSNLKLTNAETLTECMAGITKIATPQWSLLKKELISKIVSEKIDKKNNITLPIVRGISDCYLRDIHYADFVRAAEYCFSK